jgi:hypothetical protein
LSAYISNLAITSAKRDIKEIEDISLNDDDRNLFFGLLIRITCTKQCFEKITSTKMNARIIPISKAIH